MRDFFMDGAAGGEPRGVLGLGATLARGSQTQLHANTPGANPGPSLSHRGDLKSCAAAGAPRAQGGGPTPTGGASLPRDGICVAATWRPFAGVRS